MNFKNFQDYIKNLCSSNKLVRHGVDGRKTFFRMNGEEVLAAIPNNAASPYVVITSFTGRPAGEEGEKLSVYADLLFLSKASAMTGNRSDEVERAQEEAYTVMWQFISKIKEDYENDDGCGDLQYLQPDRMQFEPVGPMNQLEYGWSLILPFRTQMPEYNDNDWN